MKMKEDHFVARKLHEYILTKNIHLTSNNIILKVPYLKNHTRFAYKDVLILLFS